MQVILLKYNFYFNMSKIILAGYNILNSEESDKM